MLSLFLERHPADTIAMHLMGEAALRLVRKEEAEALLARCLALAPAFAAARYGHANVLAQLNKPEAALAQLDLLRTKDRRSLLYRNLQAAVLTAVGKHAESLLCHARLAEDFPRSPEVRINYGNALRSMGLTQQCIEAYRDAIALSPSSGNAYWSLAGLKNYRFSNVEIGQMQDQLARADLSGEDRMYFHFALGKALGDGAQYQKSFDNYARANAIKRLGLTYDPGALTKHVGACKALFTREFLQVRAGIGCGATGPIFIIG